MFLILILFFRFEISNAVKCFQGGLDENNRTCEGDFCVISRAKTYVPLNNERSCFSGVKKPSYNCTLDYDDNMVCFCETDFCNTPSLYHTNVTIFPIIQCKTLVQKIYRTEACNKCIRIISYLKHDRYEMNKYPNQNEDLKDLEELVGCNDRGNSGDLLIDSFIYLPEKILRNFFVKACYNVSMHREHYYVHCRCLETNCNTPETPTLPYPISPPKIKCHTSGYDADVNNKKYEKLNSYYKDNYQELMINDTFVDDESECQGHYCFISSENRHILDGEYDIYYKGCISANEQGEQKLSLGYSYLNNVPYYICNTDYCNVDIATALEQARNASLAVFDHNQTTRIDVFFLYFFVSLLNLFDPMIY